MAEPDSMILPAPLPEEPARKQWKPHPALICVLLAALTCAVFYPAARSQFVTYDDPDYVTENAHVKDGLSAPGVAWAFRTGDAGNWHPLTWISHMADVQLFGLSPRGPHITSILFHAANSVLLFLALWRLTGAVWRSTLVAAFFALHPLHVESVAWISERKDVLSAFFFMLTLLAYSSYAGKTSRNGRIVGYIFSLLWFALGLMSKPMLVTVPFVLLLLDFWPLQRLRQKSPYALVAEKIPFFVLSAGSCLVTLFVQKEAEQSLSNLSLGARFGNTVVSYLRYLGKSFWPLNLVTPYPHPGHWPLTDVLLASLALMLLTVAALCLWRKLPFVLVGWFWFLGMLVPVIGIVQVGEQSMADRYTYLPLIGIFILLIWGAGAVSARLRLSLLPGALLAVALLALCTARTRHQLHYWRDSETLYRHAVAASRDNFIAYYNLGSYLDHRGQTDEAMTNYLRAIAIQPHYQDPLNNIGVLLTAQKQFAEAVPYFEAAVRSKPDFTDAHNNLGNALRELKRYQDAIPHFKAVIEKRPADAGALNNLGNALAAQGQFAEAIPYYETSLRVKTNQAAAHYDLGNALLKLRRLDAAVAQYRLALGENPKQPQAHNDLGVALAMKGNADEAVVELRESLRLEPENVTALLDLGKVLGGRGLFEQARPCFEQAVRLAPDNPEAHSGLGVTLAASGNLDEAIAQFESSIHLRPGNPSTHFNLGKALAAKGRLPEAREHYSEALRLNPNYTPALKELNATAPAKTE